MRVSATEEFILNQNSPVFGWRRFRLEYGGHAEDCIVEGVIYIPLDKLHKALQIVDTIERLFK